MITDPNGYPVWPGQFFRPIEFDCHDGTAYPAEWIGTRLTELVVGVLDPLRSAWSGPLEVVSGYRTPAHNRTVGGVPKSWHCEGRAADLRPLHVDGEPFMQTVKRLHELCESMWQTGALALLGGLGLYPSWIHVDTGRTTVGHLRKWTGAAIGGEQTT